MQIRLIYCQALLILFMFIGCETARKTPEFSLSDFIDNVNLKGDLGRLENAKMPMGICVIAEKNLLLIIDVDDSTYIKAYNLQNYQLIKSFAKKGSGPNDQMDCQKLQYSNDLKYLYAIDRIKQKIFLYDLNDITNPSKNVLPISDVTLEDHQLYSPVILNDGRFVDYSSQSKEKDSLFSLFNPEGELISKKGSFPEIEKQYTPQELKVAFLGWFTKSKDGKHIILSYLNTDYLDLYDEIGNLKKRLHGPDIFDPEVKSVTHLQGKMVIPDSKAYFAYSSARMNGNEVYALYEGKNILEAGGYHKVRLFSFDANLKPQISYRLAQPIFAFDIDWSTHTLYGLTHKFNGKNIIKIKIP